MIQTQTFRIEDDLPIGQTMLIEASAGTGKTYTLAALTTRLVAEHDVAISQILLATFNTAAAGELRERIRGALLEAESHLEAPTPNAGPLLDHLAGVGEVERSIRHARLARAVREFDRSNISTIHGFCAGVLETQGALSGSGPGSAAELVQESELIRQVSSDLLFAEANRAAPDGDAHLPTLKDLRQAIGSARDLGAGEITAESEQPCDELLAQLARAAVSEIDRRLRNTNSQSFTSMISSVRDMVTSDPQLVGELRRRFRVALIDEFQDTDPYQWEIFKTIFSEGDPRPTLIMVGDPKQAIYGFRGGDVYAYLEARKGLTPKILGTNHRSIPQVVNSMNLIGAGQFFGEEDIAYQHVEPSQRNSGRRLVVQDGHQLRESRVAPGLDIRCIDDEKSLPSKKRKPGVDDRRSRIVADLADTAVELLHTASLVSDDPSEDQNRPLKPSDIAVLVPTGELGQTVAAQLARSGVPSVKLTNDSVLDSAAAKQWQILLRAIERPSDQTRAAAAAITWFFGWSADSLAAAVASDPTRSDTNVELTRLVELQYELARWARILETLGVSALFAEIRRVSEVIPLLLSDSEGERNITDLEHIAELLHRESGGSSRGVSPTQALEVMDSLMAEGSDKSNLADHLRRRVESDADAVQIMTIHRAKGLEFPVVLLPDLWAGGKSVQADGSYSFFDSDRGKRVLDVSTKRVARNGIKSATRAKMAPHASSQTKRQNCGDQHRLTYVAMTRASHLTVAWWATGGNGSSALTGLARLLFGVEGQVEAGQPIALPDGGETVKRIRERFDPLGGGDTIRASLIPAPEPYPVAYDPGRRRAESEIAANGVPSETADESEVRPGPGLAVAELGRPLARSGFRWSFSSLKDQVVEVRTHVSEERSSVAGSSQTGSESLPRTNPTVENSDDRGAGDEAESTAGAGPVDTLGGDWAAPTLWEGLGAGTDFGTLVHELYEAVDFADPEPETAFRDALVAQRRHGVTPEQYDRLPVALAATLATPLGASFEGLTLADIGVADRLNELDFYIPVAPDGIVAASRIGEIAADYLEPDHPLRSWANRLADGLHHVDLTGYLSGAIDLIFRYEVNGRTRYSVLDYKTNRLSGQNVSNLGDYHPDQLVKAMEHSHYVLQAVIYSVALHRYLRLRVPDYRPATDLGPVAYAFVRGMAGDTTPSADSGFWKGSTAGVFAWSIPASLIEALSDAFDNDSTDADTGREASR